MDTIQTITEGQRLISGEPILDFLIRLAVNIISTFVLIRFIYYPNNSRVKYLFTFFLMGMMIFLIASILDKVSIEMGFALGLFAIFGIIRYRSPSIDLKEMTYLFLIIGMSIINALVEFNVAAWFGLLIANFIILSTATIMEIYKPKNYVLKRALTFSPSSYAVMNNNKDLLNEIREKTGINVLRVEITKINEAKNEVSVWIYFRENNESMKAIEDGALEQTPAQEENTYWNSSSSSNSF